MRIPKRPPKFATLVAETDGDTLARLMAQQLVGMSDERHPYPHWDKLQYLPLPNGIENHRQWWLALKLSRTVTQSPVPLRDVQGKSFVFAVPTPVAEQLHHIDLGAGGVVSLPEQITNPHTRNRYLVSSLIEEAITSSQLEGAATTREVAKRMIASGRAPRDTSERMILNNYRTIQRVRELKSEKLTPELVFELHRMITRDTLEDATAVARLRRSDEKAVVGDDFGEVFHTPPPADELPARLALMCQFANGDTPAAFVHPVIRAIILHFWLAYDHPFVDGNGRTARALFYWLMLRSGYWLFEFISISAILTQAPAKYGRSFLYTETDDNDLTYFLLSQTQVIRRAIASLHAYLDRKTAEIREVEAHLRAVATLNHRQAALITHALKHPGERYTINRHKTLHQVVYQTARTDLLQLAENGVLRKTLVGRELTFIAPEDLADRLLALPGASVAGD